MTSVGKADRYPGIFVSYPLKGLSPSLLCPHASLSIRLKQGKDGKIKEMDLCEITKKKQKGTVGCPGVAGRGGDCLWLAFLAQWAHTHWRRAARILPLHPHRLLTPARGDGLLTKYKKAQFREFSADVAEWLWSQFGSWHPTYQPRGPGQVR